MNNLLKVLLLLAVIILLFAGLANRRIVNQREALRQKADSLESMIIKQRASIVVILSQRQAYLDSIAILGSLNDALVVKNNNLRNRIAQIPLDVEQMTPDSVYTALQDVYPDTLVKPYGFSLKQIKSIYTTVLESPLKDSLICTLEARTSLYTTQISSYEAVIHSDSAIFETYEQVGANYRKEIGFKNQQIISRDKKLRRVRFAECAIGAGAFILGILVAK